MAGIYLHIPFCKQACIYCDFYFTTQKKYLPDFVHALISEIELRRDFISEPIETIYFGGGTPSLLSTTDLQLILNHLYVNFDCSKTKEITLEANPDDMSLEKLNDWKTVGINRLSVGIQSFRAEDLHLMHRAHSAVQALEAIQQARKTGFSNLNCDLIFGVPGMLLADFQENAQKMIELNPEHISAYSLTIEPRTALFKKVQLGKTIPLAEQEVRDQFLWLHEFLTQHGYEHYEISNYAKPGFYSAHNYSYWTGKAFLGLGPSAHSFDGKDTRLNNCADLKKYIQSYQNGILATLDTEKLTSENLWNEQMMTGFRTTQGISLALLEQHPDWKILEKKIEFWKENNLIYLENNKLKATTEGWIMSDYILANLFV